jgi:hypothetical protein
LRHGNFGDEITIPILKRLFGIEAIPSPMHAAELIGAGSILDAWIGSKRRLLRQLFSGGSSDLHVWGTGLMVPRIPKWPQRVHVHAVRGYLTAKEMDFESTVGDPGILASLLIPKPRNNEAAVGFVPHFVDVELVSKRLPIPANWRVVNPARPVDQVLADIAASDLIVSSSLHGLITADSFGIPCAWLSTWNTLAERSQFKFRDHASARLTEFNVPLRYEQVIEMSVDEIEVVATKPRRSIEEWQSQLIEAFPFG